MNPLITLKIALRALMRNTLRSFLTTLGIIIGVAAVIAMMAIGAGARAQVQAAFAAMGTNLLILLPGSTTSGGSHGGFGSMPTLTWDDLTAIRSELSSVKAAAPNLRSSQSLVSDQYNWTTSVTGTSPEYFQIRNWPVEQRIGLYLERRDCRCQSRCAGHDGRRTTLWATRQPRRSDNTHW